MVSICYRYDALCLTKLHRDAWKSVEGTAKEDAYTKYVGLLTEVSPHRSLLSASSCMSHILPRSSRDLTVKRPRSISRSLTQHNVYTVQLPAMKQQFTWFYCLPDLALLPLRASNLSQHSAHAKACNASAASGSNRPAAKAHIAAEFLTGCTNNPRVPAAQTPVV